MKTMFIEKKKVCVMSELNSTQTIVKEIFVDDKNNEIPHGEEFVVQTAKLAEHPLSSWEDVCFSKYKKEYEDNKDKWEAKIDKQQVELRLQYDKLYHLTKSVQGMVSAMDNDGAKAFIRLLDFMSGRINYVVVCEYSAPVIISFNEFVDKYMYVYDSSIDGVKLLTVYGSVIPYGNLKQRRLNFKLNTYQDGSGSTKDIYLFHEECEAIDKAKEIILAKERISEDLIECANKLGIKLDDKKLEKHYADKKAAIIKNLENAENNAKIERQRLIEVDLEINSQSI